VKKSERESVLFLFGRNLAEMRRKKDISQDQLAFDSDISLSALSKIERGVLNISICNAYKIAKALKVPYKDLFDFELPANKK
jgi:transcriptional regulator with XRE-family HTH domain